MTTLSQMGVPAASFGILHPKQRYRWQVIFANLGSLLPGTASLDITRQATVISRPKLEWEEVAIHRYNSTAYIAGKHTWDPMNLTIEDDITGAASTAVQNQLQTQQRIIGADLPGAFFNAAATGSDYKFSMILQQLDGNEGIVEQWSVEGCWIKSAEYGELNYDSNEAVTIQISIRFDQASQKLTGQGYGTALGGFASTL